MNIVVRVWKKDFIKKKRKMTFVLATSKNQFFRKVCKRQKKLLK